MSAIPACATPAITEMVIPVVSNTAADIAIAVADPATTGNAKTVVTAVIATDIPCKVVLAA